jgi:DNA excision repair protein ERCC-2
MPGLQLRLQGRIDGIFVSESPVMLEEIKTTLLDLSQIDEDHNPLHWAQVRVYAFIYAEQLDLSEVAIQLTYYQVESQTTRSFKRVYTIAELETFFESLLTDYLPWAKQRYEWLVLREATIEAFEFPYVTATSITPKA